jgi:hypothetical protein
VLEDRIAFRIVEESLIHMCDAIVLGTRRLRGLERLSGRGVREQVLRLSPLPVIASPTPLTNAVHIPPGGGSHRNGRSSREGYRTGDDRRR